MNRPTIEHGVCDAAPTDDPEDLTSPPRHCLDNFLSTRRDKKNKKKKKKIREKKNKKRRNATSIT